MAYQRDPVSLLWDTAAAHLLSRAYQTPGQWVASRLADPTPGQLARMAAHGVNAAGRDNVKGHAARSRWARGFVRAIHHHARGVAAIEVDIGRALPVRGVIPAGRAVRIRVRAGGNAARRAAMAKPAAERIYDDNGNPGPRWADPADRDW